MREPEEVRRQEVLLRRLSALGLAARPFPDGRGVAVTLPLGPERFELPGGGSARFDSVSFATVGGDRIKCLKPLPFFHLPLIKVGGCARAGEFEARMPHGLGLRSADSLTVLGDWHFGRDVVVVGDVELDADGGTISDGTTLS